MMLRSISLMTALGLSLAACGSAPSQSTSSHSRGVEMLVPVNPSVGMNFINADITPFLGRNGTYTRIDVTLGGRQANAMRRGKPVLNANPQLAMAAARAMQTGTNQAAMQALASQAIMASGYCPSGALRANTGVTRYSNPSDVGAIVSASRAQGRDVIPAGVRGTSVSPVRRTQRGWEVLMTCGR